MPPPRFFLSGCSRRRPEWRRDRRAGSGGMTRRRFDNARARRHAIRTPPRTGCMRCRTLAEVAAGCLDWILCDGKQARRWRDKRRRNPGRVECIGAALQPCPRPDRHRRSSCIPARSRSTPRCNESAAGSDCRARRGESKSFLELSSASPVRCWSNRTSALRNCSWSLRRRRNYGKTEPLVSHPRSSVTYGDSNGCTKSLARRAAVRRQPLW